MSSLVIIITSYVSNPFQETMLINCINAAQKVYPTAHIVILNDNHQKDLTSLFEKHSIVTSNLEVVLTPAPRAGEGNAYLWAIENTDKYELFLFIHDSVLLKSAIREPIHSTLWNPLWYAESAYASGGLGGKEMQDIIESLNVDGKVGNKHHAIIHNKQIHVTFGAMGIWTSEFSRYLRDKTNIRDVFPKCNTRPKRCIIERFMTIIFHTLHPTIKKDEFRQYACCGDIMRHGNAFRNSNSLNTEASNNPFAFKIWQGR